MWRNFENHDMDIDVDMEEVDEWLEAWTRNPEVPYSSPLADHLAGFFQDSPLFKSLTTLCKEPTEYYSSSVSVVSLGFVTNLTLRSMYFFLTRECAHAHEQVIAIVGFSLGRSVRLLTFVHAQ